MQDKTETSTKTEESIDKTGKQISLSKLKIKIFNEIAVKFDDTDFQESIWEKKIIDLIIFCGGKTRATKFLSRGMKSKNTWLESIYFQYFKQKINKKRILKNIFNKLSLYERSLRDLLVSFFILKFDNKIEVIAKKAQLNKNTIIQQNLDFEIFTPKSNPIKHQIQIRAKKGFVNFEDIKTIASNLNCTVQNIRINVKRMNVQYKSNSQIKKENKKTEFDKQMHYFKINNFVCFEKKYWISKTGSVFKVNNNNKIKKVVPMLRQNQHGYNYYIVSIQSKQYHFHKLIAQLFIPNPYNYKYVRAIDKDPTNFSLNNLEWIKYPAVSRVINKISKQDTSWLNFVLDNIKVGWPFSSICKKLTTIANKNNFFINNKNKKSTIETIIKNYSQSNPVFPIFIINKKAKNKVYVNYELLEQIKKGSAL